jgi:hypothetical protein
MRRIDKKLNMMKVNLLAESRYLESKGLINESVDVKKNLLLIKNEFEELSPNFTINNDALKINSLKLEITYDLKDETYKIINDKGEQYFNKIGRFSECTDCKFRELADVIEFIKSEEKKLNEDGFSLDEMDYKRVIDNKDFDFLNKQEFNGWGYEQIDDSKFKITNKEYPNFEFIVSLDKGKHSNAGKYPWNYEAKHTGGRNLPTSGHQGVYTIERNATSDLENTFLKFINSNEKKLNETMLPIIDNFGDRKMAFAENEDELEEGFFKNTIKKVKDFGNRVLDITSKEEEAKKQQAIDEIIKFNFESLFLQPVEGQVLNADLAEQRVSDAAKKMPTVKELNPILFEIKGSYFSNATMKIGGKIYRGVIPSCFESIRDVNDEITNEEAIRRMIGFLG